MDRFTGQRALRQSSLAMATLTASRAHAKVSVARESRYGGAKLAGPVLAEDTLRDILDDMLSVPG